MNKTLKIEIQDNCFAPYSGEIVEQPEFGKFVDTAGGELAIAIFKGNFQSTLSTYLSIAHARGKLAYHRQLVEQHQANEKNRRKKPLTK